MAALHQVAGFFELWNPVLLLLVIVVGLLYKNLVGPWREKFSDSHTLTNGQKRAFYIGLVLFYIGQGSPLNYIGHHYLFSFHMLQQSILYLIMPICIWIGFPSWILRRMLSNSVVKGLFSFFTKPLISLFLFNMLFSIYHMPMIMDRLMMNEWLGLGYHLILLTTAFMMWFPVFCPVPEMNRLSELKKIGYIFANGVLLTPACALIIFADTLLYDMYKNAVVPFAFLPAIEDQQLGGVVMKILQEIVYGWVLSYIFFRWYRRERKEDLDDYPQGYEPQKLVKG